MGQTCLEPIHVSIDKALPDRLPPRDEFLVADADWSQNYAINAVVAGNNLVVKGPPGTGKSQTITNPVAALIARGHTRTDCRRARTAPSWGRSESQA